MPDPKSAKRTQDKDLTGAKLGDYQMLRRLGRGGMAEVWLAEQGALGRQVAVKVLKSELATDQTYVHRFQREARAAASLIHANIVQIYDVGCTDDGIHYIAQEYIQGQNLRQYMVRHGPPELRLALAIVRQVASALHKAGEHGIIHRDIKPDNIMLARTGEVKVADFGLARASDEVNLTQVGMTMGTPLYMSPEQVEGRALDPRSDIYSFGVTCYHMLAGTPPFRGDNALSVAVQHLKTRPEPLEQLRPDLPPGLCRIVHKMLSKDPAQRYPKAREILRDLRTLRTEMAEDDAADEQLGELDNIDEDFLTLGPGRSATQRLSQAMRNETRQMPKSRRRRWLAPVLVTIAGLLTGGVIGISLRPTCLLADAYVRRAKQQLARLYLRRGEYEEAERLFDEFANLPDTETEGEFRAFGLAGKCVVLAMDQNYEQMEPLLYELWPIREHLDAQMATLIRDLVSSHSKASSEWQAWRETEFAPDGGQVPDG